MRVRGSGPVAFGSFTFDASSEGSVLIVPRILVGRDGHGQAWLTTVTAEREPDLRALGWPAAPVSLLAPPPAAVRWEDGSLPGPQWQQAVAEAVAAIKAGRLRKVVLAQDLFATAPETIDVRAVARLLASRYPDCFTFACDGMVGATPELLIRQSGRQVSALVLAGTAPRGDDPAQDEALGAALLASAKNTEEHAYAVASMRETLGPLCDELDSQPRPGLIKLPNLQHLGTWVRGTLAADGTPRSALGLAAAVHPTAAVAGTPTGAALELIRELEHMDRERYAGPVGWVDADGNGEWGIALRCAQLSGRTARLFAGAASSRARIRPPSSRRPRSSSVPCAAPWTARPTWAAASRHSRGTGRSTGPARRRTGSGWPPGPSPASGGRPCRRGGHRARRPAHCPPSPARSWP